MIALITCVVLIGLMLLGVPVCAAMGGTAAAMFASLGYGNILAVMAQRIYNGTTSFTMLAIPFFILAGNLMNTGGITDRIFNFAKAMVGHWPGRPGPGEHRLLRHLLRHVRRGGRGRGGPRHDRDEGHG